MASGAITRLRPQVGMATLLLVVVLGAMLLLAVVGLAGQRQLELRALSGEASYIRALLQAEAALAMAVEAERLEPGGVAPASTAVVGRLMVDSNGHPDWPFDRLLEVSANSRDGLATATVRQWWWQRPLLKQLPLVPLMVQGSLSLEQLTLAAAGDGELLGLVSGAEPPPLALERCAPTLVASGCPPLWRLPVRAERRLMADLLAQTFGLGMPWLRDAPGFTRAADGDCATQLRAAEALWWSGDCLLYGTAIGSALRPRLLVVDAGRLRVAADTEINGLLLVAGDGGTVAELHWGEGALLRGALLVAGDAVISGQPRIWFDLELLNRLQQRLRVTETVPGSWRDW